MGLHEETNTVMQIHFIPDQVSKNHSLYDFVTKDLPQVYQVQTLRCCHERVQNVWMNIQIIDLEDLASFIMKALNVIMREGCLPLDSQGIILGMSKALYAYFFNADVTQRSVLLRLR